MDQKTFQQRIAALDTLVSDKEFDEIPVSSISKEDQIALRDAFKICMKSGKKESFILEDCELLCSLGKVAHRLGWFKEAETFFRTSVEKNTQHPTSWFNYGLVLKSQGRKILAEEMFKNALAFAPANWDKKNKVLDLLGNPTPPIGDLNKPEEVRTTVQPQPNPLVLITPETTKKQVLPTKPVQRTGKCAVCEKLVGSMAYVCRYCGREHCQDHRIPEKHNCGPGFRPIRERQMPTSNADLVKEIARIGQVAANKAYIDISIKNLSEFDEKLLKHAFSILNAPDIKPETYSDDFELWFRAGKVAQRLSWPYVAEKFYRIALIFGTEVDAWKNLGQVCEAQGKISDAEDAYRKVTLIDPDNADAWMRLGNLYEQEGRRDEAKVAHQTSFKHDPRKAREYLENRPWQYYRNLQNEESYQKRIEANETDSEAWFALGILRYIKHELSSAEQAFRTGLKYDPNNSEMWNTLGCVLLDQQHIDRGEKCYRQAIETEPNNWYAHYNLGLICAQNDRIDAAIDEFQICSDLIPGDVRPWVHLCLLLKSRGRVEESKAAWEKIRVLEPSILSFLPEFEKLYRILKPYKDPGHLYT